MSLPIADHLPKLCELLAVNPNVILQAEPGAGKTTLVPLELLRQSFLADSRIIMLEPRRLAARTAAFYMASCLCEQAGETVGYRTRLDTRVSKQTRLEVVTEGVLTRMLQHDPALEGYDLIIFDEFHERSLQADLGLALCLDVQQNLRDDLKLLLMSATLDGDALSKLLCNAPVLNCPGRQYPVELYHVPCEPRQRWDKMLSTVRHALQQHEGSLLVFLPGAGEIRRIEEALRQQSLGPEILIAPLYGELDRQQQLQAIEPAPQGQRKIVLATNIAETSLTIDGISVVIDSGLARQARFDAGSGLTRLHTRQISQASAKQRAGRAGRLQAGHCYRLWSEAEQQRLLEFDDAEIKHADLLPLVLELAQWGVRQPQELTWLDLPTEGNVEQARSLARQLELLDADNRVTELGQQVRQFGVHPRLGHMILRGVELGLGPAACELAAMLGERPLLGRNEIELHEHYQALHSANRGVDRVLQRRILRQAKLWQEKLGKTTSKTASAMELGLLLALAFPDRIAKSRTAGGGRYRLSNGKGASLPPHHPLAAESMMVVAELGNEGAEPTIRLAAPVNESDLRHHLSAQIEQRDRIGWDRESGAVVAQQQDFLGQILLQQQELPQPNPTQMAEALLQGIKEEGLDCLPWDQETLQLRARVELLRQLFNDQPWPDFSDSGLQATLHQWLLPYLQCMSRLSQLKQLDLKSVLLARLDWAQQQQLEQLAPSRFQVPTGSNIAIDYSVQPPVLAVKLQELYGCDQHPTIAGGRTALMLHLLSPAMRPAQVTQDLPGFWRDSYQLVKKDLKGRYPKHYWPDDPLQAQPLRGGKKQLKNIP